MEVIGDFQWERSREGVNAKDYEDHTISGAFIRS
jgi:hypothetical protein